MVFRISELHGRHCVFLASFLEFSPKMRGIRYLERGHSKQVNDSYNPYSNPNEAHD